MSGLEVAALHSNSSGKSDDYFANRLSRFTLRRPIGENISPLETGGPTFLRETANEENHRALHSNRPALQLHSIRRERHCPERGCFPGRHCPPIDPGFFSHHHFGDDALSEILLSLPPRTSTPSKVSRSASQILRSCGTAQRQSAILVLKNGVQMNMHIL
jgi:hypothetical protein